MAMMNLNCGGQCEFHAPLQLPLIAHKLQYKESISIINTYYLQALAIISGNHHQHLGNAIIDTYVRTILSCRVKITYVSHAFTVSSFQNLIPYFV